jgi:predicted nuclease of restriction endonuclease-like (RecB) superfamily
MSLINKDSIALIHSNKLFEGIDVLIHNAKSKVSVYLNAETTLLYWSIGTYINQELKQEIRLEYGAKILATLSQQLTYKHGKGFTYSALTRMSKVAGVFDNETIATLSQQLSWSHLIELATIENQAKRLFFAQMSVAQQWGIRELRNQIDTMAFERSAIAQKSEPEIVATLSGAVVGKTLNPDLVFKSSYILDFLNLPYLHSEKELENAILNQLEKFIMELGNGFAFLERQKRIPVDAIDYHLDLLFYHRKINRLVAIDLKIGKFKPEYKAQMELYLRWLDKYERQPHEEKPVGLLLCSEGNTEHIELLMLDEKEIRVAQYLTELPDKQWFIDKLHRAIAISKNNADTNNNE